MALTLDNQPWWVGLLIGLALAVAIVAGVHYLVITDINDRIASDDRDIATLDEKIANGRAAERKLPQFRDEVRRLELELDKLRRILPSTRNTEEIIKKIKSLVDQGEFALRSLTFPRLGEAKSGDPYAEWPISVSVDGRYHNLAILFNRLGNFSRIMNVENINIGALGDQSTKTISSQFTAKTFVYVEPKEDKDAKKAAAAKPAGGAGKPGGGGTGE